MQDGNGSLDATEIYHFCAKMGLKLTAAQVLHLVSPSSEC